MFSADEFYQDVAGSLCQLYPNAYLSSWSGAEFHNLTASSSLDYTLFSDSFDADGEVRHYNQRVFLKKIPTMPPEHILSVPSLNGGFKVADMHQTVVDMLTDTVLAGGDEVIDEVWENYFLSPDADVEKLTACAHQSRRPAVVMQILKRVKDK